MKLFKIVCHSRVFEQIGNKDRLEHFQVFQFDAAQFDESIHDIGTVFQKLPCFLSLGLMTAGNTLHEELLLVGEHLIKGTFGDAEMIGYVIHSDGTDAMFQK